MEHEPWNPTEATNNLRTIGQHPGLTLAYKLHARDRLAERSIILSDVLYILRNGFVYVDPVPAKKSRGYWRYQMECRTPNSEGRVVRVVVIPNANAMTIKIVTVMWADEDQTRAGTILKEEED